MTKYPSGTDFDPVIKAQFDIAKLYLGGKKSRVLGLSVQLKSPYEDAEKMFAEIVKRAPFHRLAPLSLFNYGLALEKQAKVPEAVAAYKEVISRFPGDPVANDAQYQIGYVQLHEAQTGSYNQQTRQQAMESFEEFTNRQPKSEKSAQARENMKALNTAEIKNTMDIAKFYDKTKNYKAAAVLLRGDPERARRQEKRPGPQAHRGTQDHRRCGCAALRPREGADWRHGARTPARTGARGCREPARLQRPGRPLPPLPDDGRPHMRTPLAPMGPFTEPPLPAVDPLQDPSLPKLRTGDSLIPLAPLPPVPEPGKTVTDSPKKAQ